MNTMEIARQLVALCQQGKNEEALQTLFSPEVVSVEAMAMADGKQESVGMAAVKAKGE